MPLHQNVLFMINLGFYPYSSRVAYIMYPSYFAYFITTTSYATVAIAN